MHPPEILKFRSFEAAGNVSISIYSYAEMHDYIFGSVFD